jgi:NifU-like protein involved in Fe-S cluster formation
MNEAVIKFYRRLLKEDFPNSGSLDHPSAFVEAIGERMIHCGNTGNYMQLYLNVIDDRIEDIKYLCSCEPTANVAVEVLCTMVKGKTLDEAAAVSERAFYQSIGCEGDELKIKVQGLLELLNEGIAGYRAQPLARKILPEDMWE